MNTEQREAAERLADDLQRFDGAERESLRDEAADLLRELLAEPVQEPLFWVRLRSDGGYEGPIAHSAIEEVRRQSGAWTPLYAAPQQRKPLTPTEALVLFNKHYTTTETWADQLVAYARAIERAITGGPT